MRGLRNNVLWRNFVKRLVDIAVAAILLLLASPILAAALFLVWLQDRKSPIYKAVRVGRGGRTFTMIKVRSMVTDADRSGVESTGVHDARITEVGHFIRRWKIDELPQLWNVLRGEMSLVGPRPNTQTAISRYTSAELRLLELKPGITDLSSIIFSDEGEILNGKADPDTYYYCCIAPWKSQLGMIYIENSSALLDLRIVGLTLLALFDRPRAIHQVGQLLEHYGASDELKRAASRAEDLTLLSVESHRVGEVPPNII